MEKREGVGGGGGLGNGWREVEKVVCEGVGWGSQPTSPNPLLRQSQEPAAGRAILKYISFFFFFGGRLNGDLWPEELHSLWLN